MVLARQKIKKMLDAQGFDPRTSRMRSGRATKCTMHPSLILLDSVFCTPSCWTENMLFVIFTCGVGGEGIVIGYCWSGSITLPIWGGVCGTCGIWGINAAWLYYATVENKPRGIRWWRLTLYIGGYIKPVACGCESAMVAKYFKFCCRRAEYLFYQLLVAVMFSHVIFIVNSLTECILQAYQYFDFRGSPKLTVDFRPSTNKCHLKNGYLWVQNNQIVKNKFAICFHLLN